jgi:hypothetical protein
MNCSSFTTAFLAVVKLTTLEGKPKVHLSKKQFELNPLKKELILEKNLTWWVETDTIFKIKKLYICRKMNDDEKEI